MKTGIELIAEERQEQIEKHKRTIQSDIEINNNFELCAAASAILYNPNEESPMDLIRETKLMSWNPFYLDKMNAKPYKERLIIAGALIAAEIDRINNIESKTDIVDEEQEDWEQKAKRLWQDRSTRLEAVKIVYDKRKPKMKLSEAKAYCEKNFAVAPVDEDELWQEVVNISEDYIADLGDNGEILKIGGKVIEALKAKFSITRKQ